MSAGGARSYFYHLKIELYPEPLQPNNSRPILTKTQKDWRYGPIRLESVDMDGAGKKSANSSSAQVNDGQHAVSATRAGRAPQVSTYSAKARVEPVARPGHDVKSTELGWGVVHLYREGEETPGLAGATPAGSVAETSANSAGQVNAQGSEQAGLEVDGEDTTILCIPAVPSYMLPSDFLGWVGEKTRDQVSHFRMVMTERMNRYLVLMKFRDGLVARRWRQEWDGKVFNGMEPENCHVMFVKSILFDTPIRSSEHPTSFPDMSHDPFTPAMPKLTEATASLAFKPFPPPTPSLVELPTCPVCLERMDDTTGLLTILCQHVFHCACLQKWRGSGCPVCRHTQPSPSLDTPFGARPVGVRSNDLCAVCDCPDDLWICLVCGNVGCGRYKGGHAKEHFKDTAHCYSLEIETQYVWDYAADIWVHRLIQTKGDGKLVELPSNSRGSNTIGGHGRSSSRAIDNENTEELEMVPRTKLENIGMEYTQMLTSQLESQRVYFEDVVKKAVDKASAASKSAEAAAFKADEAMAALQSLRLEHAHIRDDVVPSLERERDRMVTKAEKSNALARAMTKSFQEEKQVGRGLMQRIEHVNESMVKMGQEVAALREENADLKEQNRDLGFFISSQEKLKSLEGELRDEVAEGTVSLPERREGNGKGRNKGKGRGK